MCGDIEELLKQVTTALKDVPDDTRALVLDLVRGYHEAHGKRYPALIGETHTQRILKTLDSKGAR